MQSFFQIHNYLLKHLGAPVNRELMGQVDWDHRLIGIRGARGVGKTTFLLDYAKQAFGLSKHCLYVNLNNLYFTERSIISFADEFRKKGGQTLLLDQVYKYPEWSKELKYCYDHFDDLRIVFSGSSVMHLQDDKSDLKGCVKVYDLQGFSFREYLNIEAGTGFKPYTIDEIMRDHVAISREIIAGIRPLAYFSTYLEKGYYPYFLEKRNYLENVLKNINLILEIDISFLEQIELKYLPKLRKLVYSIAKVAPFQPNVSRLSQEIETSRATVMNYLNYLKNGRLINLLFEDGEAARKPSLVYVQNSNLLHSLLHGEVDQMNMNRTFFFNQLSYGNKVDLSKKGDFKVNNEMEFTIIGERGKKKKDYKGWYAHDMLETGSEREVPLWLFGFLY